MKNLQDADRCVAARYVKSAPTYMRKYWMRQNTKRAISSLCLIKDACDSIQYVDCRSTWRASRVGLSTFSEGKLNFVSEVPSKCLVDFKCQRHFSEIVLGCWLSRSTRRSRHRHSRDWIRCYSRMSNFKHKGYEEPTERFQYFEIRQLCWTLKATYKIMMIPR